MASGDVGAMKQLAQGYASIVGGDPSSAGNMVRMASAIARATIDAGGSPGKDIAAPAAAAALGAGMVGGGASGYATDKAGNQIGRIVVDSRGNAMIEPVGGRTVAAGQGGVDTHTLFANGSNYQRLNAQGHANNPTPHGHGHALGTGPGMRGQGASLDVHGNVVPSNSAAAHWPIN